MLPSHSETSPLSSPRKYVRSQSQPSLHRTYSLPRVTRSNSETGVPRVNPRDRIYHRYPTRHEPTIEEYRGNKWEYEFKTFLMLLASFASLWGSWHTMFTIGLAIGSTLFCYKMELTSDMPISLISVGLFFPVSFGINWTFTRRENLLMSIADLKASVLDLYYCIRDWQKPNSTLDQRLKVICCKLLSDISIFAMHGGSTVNEIYESIDDMTLVIEELRKEDDWIRSVISRAYQYRRFVCLGFEKIRITHDYRTPSTLRAYALVFTTLCPVLFAPYFAKLSKDYGLWSGLYSSSLAVSMLITLYRVYYEQEDPCDASGRDDLNVEIINQVVDFMNVRSLDASMLTKQSELNAVPEILAFK